MPGILLNASNTSQQISLEPGWFTRQIVFARACGLQTDKSRQGRKAATVLRFAFAAATLAFKPCCAFHHSGSKRIARAKSKS